MAGLAQAFAERRNKMRGAGGRASIEISNHRRCRLLRACPKRPLGGGADQARDERPAPHSITSSARARSVGGIVRPRVLAVFKLTMNWNLVGCSTARSDAL